MTPWRFALHLEGASGSGDDRIDCFAAQDANHRDTFTILIVDGAGGIAGAAPAADASIDYLRSALRHPDASSTNFAALLRALDHHLLALPFTGEVAALALCLSPGILRGASVGDCEAWLVGSTSHNAVTEGQHRKPLLGSGEARPTVFSHPFSEEQILIAGTDGLFRYTPSSELPGLVRSTPLGLALSELVNGTRLPRGTLQDDLAAIILTGAPLEEPPPRPRVPAARPQHPPPETSTKPRVLFAEAHTSFARAVIQSFLADFEVLLIPSIAEALEQVERNNSPFEWLFVDDRLSDGSGVTLVQTLRSVGYAGRIIAVSGRDRSNAELITAGADAACPKMKFSEIRKIMASIPR